MNQGVAILVLLIVLAILTMIFVPRWRVKRAAKQVIKTFRKNSATSINNARTLEELGLKPRGFLDGMFRGRDYKPYAMSALMKAGILRETEDGKLYLSEDKLSESNIAM